MYRIETLLYLLKYLPIGVKQLLIDAKHHVGFELDKVIFHIIYCFLMIIDY